MSVLTKMIICLLFHNFAIAAGIEEEEQVARRFNVQGLYFCSDELCHTIVYLWITIRLYDNARCRVLMRRNRDSV